VVRASSSTGPRREASDSTEPHRTSELLSSGHRRQHQCKQVREWKVTPDGSEAGFDSLSGCMATEHKIRWFARFPGSHEDWTPRSRTMCGSGWNWDVRCSCGWETRTGGATESSIRSDVWLHKWWAKNA
jgi:hypothetical protein